MLQLFGMQYTNNIKSDNVVKLKATQMGRGRLSTNKQRLWNVSVLEWSSLEQCMQQTVAIFIINFVDIPLHYHPLLPLLVTPAINTHSIT